VKEYGRKEVKIYASISEELDGNCQLHASASLTPEKQPLTPFLIAGYMDSRGDPDDAAEKRKFLAVPGVELSDRCFPKFLRDI
jgi:hypothetical protein